MGQWSADVAPSVRPPNLVPTVERRENLKTKVVAAFTGRHEAILYEAGVAIYLVALDLVAFQLYVNS